MIKCIMACAWFVAALAPFALVPASREDVPKQEESPTRLASEAKIVLDRNYDNSCRISCENSCSCTALSPRARKSRAKRRIIHEILDDESSSIGVTIAYCEFRNCAKRYRMPHRHEMPATLYITPRVPGGFNFGGHGNGLVP